jgi:hypothetical protein
MATTKKKIVNKSAWIRSQPASTPAKDLVAKAKQAGIQITEGQVYTARSEQRRKGTPAPVALKRAVRAATAAQTDGGLDAMVRAIVREEIRAYFSKLG